jgi:F-type H+-transporting ATPase subunit epsilon
MATLRLVFVTPEKTIAHEEVDEVQLPLADGYAGILPGHAPMLAALRTGQMWYRKGGQTHYGFVSGGFVEVMADRVSVLARIAERGEDIDLERAEAAKRRAEERVAKPMMEIDTERARIALLRAISRLDAASRSGRQRR